MGEPPLLRGPSSEWVGPQSETAVVEVVVEEEVALPQIVGPPNTTSEHYIIQFYF